MCLLLCKWNNIRILILKHFFKHTLTFLGHDSIPTRRTPESSLNSSGSGSSFRPVNPSSTTINSRRTPEETGKIRLIPESYQYQPSTPTRRGGLSPDEYNKLRGTNNIQQMLPSPKQHQQQAPLHQHQQTPPPHLQQGLSDEGGRHRPMPHDLKVNRGITVHC